MSTLKRVFDFALEDLEPTTIQVKDSGEVIWSGETTSVPEVAPVRSFDASGLVVAVAGKLSHHVHVLLGTN